MSLDERSRVQLYQRLEEVLGPDEAATLMAHLPPSGWGDVARKDDLALLAAATRADIDRLGAELRHDIDRLGAELRHEIAEVRTELKGDIAGLRTELKGDIAGLRTELKGDIAGLRTELYRSQRHLAVSMLGAIVTMQAATTALLLAAR